MKKVKVNDAVGLELIHDITEVRDGFKGVRFKRGHIIKKEDIDVLLNLGKQNIYIDDHDANKIHEVDAAIRLSKLCSIPNGHFTGVSEGKTSLVADEDGFFRIDREKMSKVNHIKDITISTLPSNYPVKKGDKLLALRIIPLECDKSEIEKAEKIAGEESLVKLEPYTKKRVGIIITGSEVYNKRIEDKFEATIRRKLTDYPHEIVGVFISDDDKEMQLNAAKDFINKGVDVLLFTGGMSVDPDDITNSTIKTLSTKFITHGVPSCPGNMTTLAYRDNIVMMGVPGAAIHSPITVLDVLLSPIFANVELTRNDLLRLSEGGNCCLCDPCHYPNCYFGKF